MNKIKKIDLIIFFSMLLIFSSYLFIFYPGILSFDSYNQLVQIRTLKFTTGHPIIHTLIEKACLMIWDSPASIAFFQILVFSITWTIICKYNRKNENKTVKIFQILITIIMCMNPLIGTYTITLWKDILYSIIILQIGFLTQILVDNKFKVGNFQIILMSFLLILIKSIRYNGMIISLLFFIILFILLYKYDKKSLNFLKLTIFCIVFHFLFTIPFMIYKTNSPEEQVSGGMFNYKLIQATGAFVHEDKLNEKETKELGKYVNVNLLKQYYNPYFSDPIGKTEMNKEYISENQNNFNKLFLKLSFKNPKTTIKFWTKSTVILWDIIVPNDIIGTTINTSIFAENKDDNINHINENTPIYNKTNTVISKTLSNIYLKTILYSPAFYLYLSIILLCYLTIKLKNYILLVVIPNIFNIIGLIISIPVQDVRYVYANFLIFFLTAIIFLKYFYSTKGEVIKNENDNNYSSL